jgi:hypothetical protein
MPSYPDLPRHVCLPAFAVIFAKFQEIKGVFIFNRRMGVRASFRRNGQVKSGLIEQGFFVGLVSL